jgi:hypothetical protein
MKNTDHIKIVQDTASIAIDSKQINNVCRTRWVSEASEWWYDARHRHTKNKPHEIGTNNHDIDGAHDNDRECQNSGFNHLVEFIQAYNRTSKES